MDGFNAAAAAAFGKSWSTALLWEIDTTRDKVAKHAAEILIWRVGGHHHQRKDFRRKSLHIAIGTGWWCSPPTDILGTAAALLNFLRCSVVEVLYIKGIK